MSFFSKYKPYIIFSSFIFVGLLVFLFISGGFYPILSVNGSLVSARTFWSSYQANLVSYQKLVSGINSVSKTQSQTNPANPVDLNEIKRITLTQIIENILISNEAEKELGKDLDTLVASRISKIDGDTELRKAAEGVYGLGFAEFRSEILVPLAKQEILTGRLFLKGEKLNDWLDNAKKSSQVKIFSGQFVWDGKDIQLKK